MCSNFLTQSCNERSLSQYTRSMHLKHSVNSSPLWCCSFLSVKRSYVVTNCLSKITISSWVTDAFSWLCWLWWSMLVFLSRRRQHRIVGLHPRTTMRSKTLSIVASKSTFSKITISDAGVHPIKVTRSSSS